MSYTEIYKFKKNGDAEIVAEVKNAFRGAMSIWQIMEEKYLPEFKPSWAFLMDKGQKCSRVSDMRGDGLKEIWGLFEKQNVSINDKIVLGTTFDNVVVMKNDLHKIVGSFRIFEGETTLKEQADIIEKLLKEDTDLIGIAWNQTSVNGDAWQSDELDEDENPLPYNILNQDKHWNLFDEIN